MSRTVCGASRRLCCVVHVFSIDLGPWRLVCAQTSPGPAPLAAGDRTVPPDQEGWRLIILHGAVFIGKGLGLALNK